MKYKNSLLSILIVSIFLSTSLVVSTPTEMIDYSGANYITNSKFITNPPSDTDFTDYIAISDENDLARIGTNVEYPTNSGVFWTLDANYYLTTDITFNDGDESNGNFIPVGSVNSPFVGIFDGNGHVIDKLHTNINGTDNVYSGLFGYIDNGGHVKNLGLMNGSSTATTTGGVAYAGGIAGYAKSSKISNCYNTGSVSASSDYERSPYGYAGGIAGHTTYVEDCYNTGIISSSSRTGGIAGLATYVKNCYNTGSVSVSSISTSYAGGIIGETYSGHIRDCHNAGAVSALQQSSYVGGITGKSSAPIENCYNTGSILVTSPRTSYAGGIVGRTSSSITNCNNEGNISASTDIEIGGIVGHALGNSNVTNCYNTGSIFVTSSGTSYAGGIAGFASDTKISTCYNMGSVSVSSSRAHAGGIAGYAGTSITDCYNMGNISASASDSQRSPYAYAGGIAGCMNAQFTNCYNIGYITAFSSSFAYLGYAFAGGIAGEAYHRIINCYYLTDNVNSNGDRTDRAYGSGTAFFDSVDAKPARKAHQESATAKTFTQMHPSLRSASTNGSIYFTGISEILITQYYDEEYHYFTAKVKGWDFTDTWAISSDVNNGYPALRTFYPELDVPASQPLPITTIIAIGVVICSALGVAVWFFAFKKP